MSLFFPDPDDSDEALHLRPVSPEALAEMGYILAREREQQVVKIDCMRFFVDQVNVTGFSGRRWTNGIVFYEFNRNVSSSNRRRWLDAAAEWSRVARLRFVARTNERAFIHVKSDRENWSHIGMTTRQQEMGIYSWDRKYVITHEIGHALGLCHEQSRSDRDKFVIIRELNIIKSRLRNFQKEGSVNYTEYDFCSILHYPPTAFSSNGLPTIEAVRKFKAYESCMGNRSYLTSLDGVGMARRYGLP